jgi:hypothetical protein
MFTNYFRNNTVRVNFTNPDYSNSVVTSNKLESSLIFVTGASDNHYKSLNQFVSSFINIYGESMKLIVYNLGLSNENWKKLQTKYYYANINYKTFDYTLYPDFVNIEINAGEYAWKPIIIYDVSIEYPNNMIVWMDSGNVILRKLDVITNHLEKYGIFSEDSCGSFTKWTHELTIKYMNGGDLVDRTCKNGACYGFNTNYDWVKSFIKDFRDLALIKDCIAPQGSNRDNHRQDQAVFTVLFYQYQKKCKYPDLPEIENYDYIFHRDID